jgi:AraC-like DNA-binding protein
MAPRSTLAFELAQNIRLSDLGILGHALSACADAEDGIRFWQTYNGLFFGNLIDVREYNQGALHYFEFIPAVRLQPYLLQFFLEEKLNIEVQVMRNLNNVLSEHKFFTFTYPTPPHIHLYRSLFKTELTFNAPTNLYAININDRFYHSPFPGADEETLEVCKKYLDDMTNILFKKTTFSARLNVAIKETFPKVMTVPEITDLFKCTTRTFCRYLEVDNTSYQREIAKAREELTKNYLLTTTLSVSEIAYNLGYQDTGSLRRAFKSWTGTNITHYRKTIL